MLPLPFTPFCPYHTQVRDYLLLIFQSLPGTFLLEIPCLLWQIHPFLQSPGASAKANVTFSTLLKFCCLKYMRAQTHTHFSFGVRIALILEFQQGVGKLQKRTYLWMGSGMGGSLHPQVHLPPLGSLSVWSGKIIKNNLFNVNCKITFTAPPGTCSLARRTFYNFITVHFLLLPLSSLHPVFSL